MFPDDFGKRDIFMYQGAGGQEVWCDPLQVERRLDHALKGRTNQLLAEARGEDRSAAFLAEEQLLEGARFAFHLPPIDPATGAGVPEKLVRAALAAYADFFALSPPSSGAGPTSSPVGSSPPQDPANWWPGDTGSPADCGPMPSGFGSAVP